MSSASAEVLPANETTLLNEKPLPPPPSDGSKWLLDRSCVPNWARSSWIISGYRPIQPSFLYCAKTIFALHNETGNIWTHLVGAVLFICLYVNFMSQPMTDRMTAVDYIMLHVFFIGIVGCLGLSTTFHTLSCHSHEMSKLFSKLDYVGITLLICCSFVPWMYYAWFNSPLLRIFYISLSVFFAIGCSIASLCDRFGERKFQKWRAALFLGDGLSAILPAIHWVWREIYTRGWDFIKENHQPGILVATMGGTYVAGGLLYMFKVPERFKPGLFDLWFNSHQLFHVLVVGAGLLYYHSLTQIMYLRLHDPEHFYN